MGSLEGFVYKAPPVWPLVSVDFLEVYEIPDSNPMILVTPDGHEVALRVAREASFGERS